MQSSLRATLISLLRSPCAGRVGRVGRAGRVLAGARAPWIIPQQGRSDAPPVANGNMLRGFLKKGDTLPVVHQLKGFSVRVERIPPDDAKSSWTVMKKAAEIGEGLNKEELEPYDQFVESCRTQEGYFRLMHVEDDQVLAVIVLINSPLLRSEKGVHFGGPLVVSHKYRGKGFSSAVAIEAMFGLGRDILGYPGMFTGRTVVRSIINAYLRRGIIYHGLVPNCSYLEGKGWFYDLTMTGSDPRLLTQDIARAPVPETPPLVETDDIPHAVQTREPRIAAFRDLSAASLLLKVGHAAPADVWRVERMIRDAAERGDGFAIDEFNSLGHLNRKMLRDSHVVVAKTTDDVIVAAAVFGATALCRAYNPQQMGGYVLVNRDYRRRGIGTAFTSLVLDAAREVGVTSVLTDAFATNMAAHMFLHKLEFFTTGTLMHCGYLRDHGYTHSSLFFRSC